MATAKPREMTVPIQAFPARCADLLDAVTHGRAERVVLVENGKPIAALVPLGESDDLWGAMRGTVEIAPDTDLTAGSGEPWEADV